MSKQPEATVFVPGTIGNVGPGFDVLGVAIDGLGDKFTATLVDRSEPSGIGSVTGRDAGLIPRDAAANCATVAALSMLRRINDPRSVRISIDRRLPVSGGLGGSAAASVGGALAALLAADKKAPLSLILTAALDGEERVAGRHLDNIAPALLGGLCICRSSDPPDVASVAVVGSWWLTVATSSQKLSTKTARQVLPDSVSRQDMVTQMANTAALIAAFAAGDHELLRRSLVDPFAEPRRAPLIEGFAKVRSAAIASGALACSISGAGPTMFAVSPSRGIAEHCKSAMIAAFHPLSAEGHVGAVATQGAYRL
jgi:homoserine kinase